MRRRTLTYYWFFLGLWFLLLWPTFSLAETILYPGSFNPFHRTHFEEVENALLFKSEAQVTILPIEEAVYTRGKNNEPLRVRLFSFPLELSFIEKSFEDNTRVRVSNGLRIMSGDPVESLLDYSKSVSDPELFILVGPDVVAKWTKSPKFDSLLERVKLIITSDPKDTQLTRFLKERFQGNERLVFNELPSSGIRGGDVRYSVVSQTSAAYDLFSPKLGEYFTRHPEVLPKALEDYRKRLLSHLEIDIQRTVLPALVENGVRPQIVDFFIKNPSLASPLFALNPDDTASIAETAERLRAHLPRSLQRTEGHTLILELVSAISNPQVYALLKSRSDTTERILFRLFEKSHSSAANKTIAKRKEIFSDPFGTWNSALTRLMKPLTQLNISDPEEIKALHQGGFPGHVEVYRGVKNRENIDFLVEEILREGFVSKVALKSSKSEAPDAGISASEKDLHRRGIQSALLEHIFGDYHNTSPFVATTLRKEIAESFAGKGGYVFKIRVPIKAGYFLNDLVFWKNTPWAHEGNPFRHLSEFIIPHQISANHILEANKVVKDPIPLPIVLLTQRAQSLRIIPFKLRTSLHTTTTRWCSELFRALHSSHF